MKKLTYRNSLGAELELTNSAPLMLLNFVETGKVNIHSNKGMNQDGATYLGNTLDVNDKTIEFLIIAESEEELINYRNKINKVVNPRFGEGYLFYKDNIKEIKSKCIINALPFFSKVNSTVTKGLINFTANNPFWMDIVESKENIALWKGQFHFPLGISKSKGIIMGLKQPSLIVNIYNKGDVETGMIIEFKAKGTLSNPSLFNVNTREYIKINKSMVAGEVIKVNTNYGEKRVENILNGVTTNILNLIDLGGGDTFLQLEVGDNLLRYDADTNPSNLEINIYFSPKYLGV